LTPCGQSEGVSTSCGAAAFAWLRKQQIVEQATAWGPRNRRGVPLRSQAIGMLLRNQLYAGIVDVPEYGVRNKRGDFDPLVSDLLPGAGSAVRARPRLPRRSFAVILTSRFAGSCAARPAGVASPGTGSKGRSDYDACYHCRPGCRGVNVTKAKLEALFTDELADCNRHPARCGC
jgi:hypothetical protein